MEIRDFTSKLTWEEVQEVFSNFEEFERDGFIGDCLLRSFSRKVVMEFTGNTENIVMWMHTIANDCYRMVAEEAIEQGFTLAK